jgi:iron(III)-enterobactin esterase
MGGDDGTLHEELVTGAAVARRVWLLRLASGNASQAAIFLDGELYIERVGAPAVLGTLRRAGRIAPTLAVFVSHVDAAARHADFTCNPDYAAFVAQDVVSWLLNQHPEVDPRRIVIAGLSLSGLAAAYASLLLPGVFCGAVCQSPSFWWEEERFRSSLPPATTSHSPYWISVGNQEVEVGVSHAPSGMLQTASQIDACQRTCEAMKLQGFNVEYRVFDGGHDCDCWRDDLMLALPWVLRRT